MTEDDRPAITGTPLRDADLETVLGDDTPPDDANPYPADGVSPDRGSSAPRDGGDASGA